MAQCQCWRLRQSRGLRVVQCWWNYRRATWSDSLDSKYRNCNSTNSVIHSGFRCGKFDSKIKWLPILIFRRMICCGSKKWRWLVLWTSWNPRDRLWKGFSKLRDMLDAKKIASALHKIIQPEFLVQEGQSASRSRKSKMRTRFCEEDRSLSWITTTFELDWRSWYSIG